MVTIGVLTANSRRLRPLVQSLEFSRTDSLDEVSSSLQIPTQQEVRLGWCRDLDERAVAGGPADSDGPQGDSSNGSPPGAGVLVSPADEARNCRLNLVLVGFQDVSGFEVVEHFGKMDTQTLAPRVLERLEQAQTAYPAIEGWMVECTQLGCFSNLIRVNTNMPVLDGITAADFFMEGEEEGITP